MDLLQELRELPNIDTVIVLRNDKTTNWEKSSHVMLSGEIGIGYLDNGNVIVKVGDGEHSWKDLSQIEGVFENDITLTHNFGRHTTTNGFVVTPAKGMTTSEWLIDALTEIKEPEIIQPTFALTATATGAGGEIGSKLTELSWQGSATYGSYQYGPDTGLSENNLTWSVTNSIDNQSSTRASGTFALTNGIQLTQEESKVYATITGIYNLNASSANEPVNNVGATTSGKIVNKVGTITANVAATAYRKPFYGVLAAGAALDVTALTSTAIRSLPGSGAKTRDLPTSIIVPIGSQMVIFAVKAGTYTTLVATDDRANNATVTFDKLSKAVAVEGANGFSAEDYDIWYVNWNPDNAPNYEGIAAAKQLTLKWT